MEKQLHSDIINRRKASLEYYYRNRDAILSKAKQKYETNRASKIKIKIKELKEELKRLNA